MNSKIIALAIVAVIVVAGTCTFILLNNDDSSTEADETRLKIYGNANLDDKLDVSDANYVQKVIDGTETQTAYCDANHDGKVDNEDLAIINKLIAGESCTLYYDDIKTGVASIEYPLTSIMGIHQNVLIPLCAIGALPLMNGYVLSEAGVTSATMLQELFDTKKNVNTSYNTVDFEKFSNLAVKPDYIITYNTSLSNEAKIIRSGTQVIHLEFSNINTMSSAILTAGFMMGLSDGAEKYVKYTDDLISSIQQKLDTNNISRKAVMCGFMTDCIDSNTGIHTTAAVAAGGKTVTDWSGTYREFAKGDEWMYEYAPEILFYCTSWGYTDNTVNFHDKYLDWADHYKDLAVYKAGAFYVVNSIMPVSLIAAYMAQAMYPEIFGEDFGDKYNNDFVQTFFPEYYTSMSYNASDYTYLITPEVAGVSI